MVRQVLLGLDVQRRKEAGQPELGASPGTSPIHSFTGLKVFCRWGSGKVTLNGNICNLVLFAIGIFNYTSSPLPIKIGLFFTDKVRYVYFSKWVVLHIMGEHYWV
jgi:hypothetical protein